MIPLHGNPPLLIDEWQIIPKIWDAVRIKVDIEKQKGMYILTGSNSTDENDNMHTGIGRISRIKMSPMSLFESKDSNGKVSLIKMFEDKNYNLESYLNALEKLYVIENIDAWNTNIRSKTSMTSSKKKVFTNLPLQL
ncbi:MAG: AAA family ATPase [Lachnospiraceae bacterium]|nr:AAA family ATPase [Lachnospiraceae bacterium]